MAASATTAAGWPQTPVSPYIGPDSTPTPAPIQGGAGAQATPAQSGSAASAAAPADVGAQLGQALSAYHTHQASAVQPALPDTTATPAPAPAADAGYAPQAIALPTQSKIGLAIGNNIGNASATGSQNTGGVNDPSLNTIGTSYTPTAGVLQYGYGNQTAYAVWDAAKGQYVPVANNAVTITGGYGAGGTAPVTYSYNGQTYTGILAGAMASSSTPVGNLNAENAAQATRVAAAQANAAAMAKAYQGITDTYKNTQVPTAATSSVNNNQDFINAVTAQMGDINQAPGVVAADTTSQNTQNALSSELSTSGYQSGGLGSAARYGAAQAVGAEGAGALSHEQAAGQAFDADLTLLGNAATQQLSLADNETQAQAASQVQSIGDELSNLQSQLGHLSTQTQLQVTNQIAALQNQIQQFQNGITNYGMSEQDAQNLFKSILSGVAQVATIAAVAA